MGRLSPWAPVFLGFMVICSGEAAVAGQDLAKLIQDLEGKDAAAANSAAMRLGELGPRAKAATRALCDYFPEASVGYKSDAIIALGKIGEASAIPSLLAALPKLQTRNSAAAHVALWMLNHDADSHASALGTILEKTEVQKSIHLGHILSYIRCLGTRASALVPTLQRIMQADECGVRATLARLGDHPQQHVRWLIGELDGASAGHAAYALGEIGPLAAPALPTLISLMKRDIATTGNIRFTVSISGIGAPAVKPLAELLEDSEPNVVFHAAIALRNIGADAKEALPMLRKARNSQKNDDLIRYLDKTIDTISSAHD